VVGRDACNVGEKTSIAHFDPILITLKNESVVGDQNIICSSIMVIIRSIICLGTEEYK